MKIDEFYRSTRDLNISENGGWAPNYYGVFSKIIEENNYKIIAEIGVGYGTHARYILLNNKDIDKLILIDPMKWYANDGFADDVAKQEAIEGENNFDRMFKLINDDLKQYSEKYVWLRKESNEITDIEIPDQSIDAIFIDGDHSYNAVLSDLTKYWNKVRSGGQILGDDYWMEQVKNAVENFSKVVGVEYDFLYKPGTNYKIFRFKKP